MKTSNQTMDNSELQLAEQFALHTNKSFFLTGKAGTGKTTLLKKITEKTRKNFVVVAPTGVAAINAGGVTIHSMFNLPISAFIPSHDTVDMNIVMNRKLLLGHFRFSTIKRRVLQELELLIIDEVSMVRCDILDAIDFTLRILRKNKEPFGGVQVILIGDMHQLPPVIRDHEWSILKNYYASPYFFDSEAWKLANASHIELQKIYRQQDETFIRILNNIRNKKMDELDYVELEKRFHPEFKPTEEGYVLLSTHNRKADQVNDFELNKLPGKMHAFEATTEGEFPENMFPCDPVLQLKAGSQVMFIKNDTDGGVYYNGRLAKVSEINNNGITVVFNDTKAPFHIHRDTWENINYSTDEATGKISKNTLGTFSQYPLRLAWAITIHKSQGLTFDKVIIDAGASFATGQVYVALSRCRSLEGIVLHSRINQSALFNDDKINSFTESSDDTQNLEQTLSLAKLHYESDSLKRLFTFKKLEERITEWEEIVEAKDIPDKKKVMELCKTVKTNHQLMVNVSEKFNEQLKQLITANHADEKNLAPLKERCDKAIGYFTNEIYKLLITPVHEHISDFAYKSKVKKYLQYVQMLEDNFWNKMNQLYQALFLDEKLFTGEIKYTKEALKQIVSSSTSVKKEKGSTYKDTLDLYNQGKTISEIAVIRGLTEGTLKGHFAKLIGTGQIDISNVLSSEIVEKMDKLLEEHGSDNLAALVAARASLGDVLDFGDLRMVIAYRNKEKAIQVAESAIK